MNIRELLCKFLGCRREDRQPVDLDTITDVKEWNRLLAKDWQEDEQRRLDYE